MVGWAVRDANAGITTLSLPYNAPPGAPRIVLGPSIPPELQAYYNVGLATMTSVILWYYGNATDTYHYYGVVDLGGGAPPGNVVRGDVLTGTVIPLDTYVGADYFVWRSAQFDDAAEILMSNVTQGRGAIGANMTDNGVVVTTVGGTEIAVPSTGWDAEPTIDFLPGRMFKATITGESINSLATTERAEIRIRKGAATITGTLLNRFQQTYPALAAGSAQNLTLVGYFKNSSSNTVSSKLSLTITRATGAGTFSLNSAGNRPLVVLVEDMGDLTTGAGANMATQLTSIST